MEFELTENQKVVRDLAREFAQKKLFPRAEEFDAREELDLALVREMGELGFLGLAIPEEYGGGGLDYLALVLAVEELSQGCASHTAVVSLHNSLFAHPVLAFGTEEQKKRFLPPIARGEKFCAFALTEPGAGSDAGALETSARGEGDFYVLNGNKVYVTDGNLADFILVYATVDRSLGHKGITAFMVEKTMPGFAVGTREKKMGYKASPTYELSFTDVRVPKENIIGMVGEGFKIAMDSLNGGRIVIGAKALGLAEGAYRLALKYAKERRQFGQPIANFQAIQFMLADMATQIEAARALIYHAARLKDHGLPHTLEGAQAKLYASEMATRVTHKAMQILGGYGYLRDYQVERYYRDARVTEIFEGTSEIQRLVIARNLLKGKA